MNNGLSKLYLLVVTMLCRFTRLLSAHFEKDILAATTVRDACSKPQSTWFG